MASHGSYEELEAKLDEVNAKLDAIMEFLEIDVAPHCQRMGEHITFVERVYSVAKTPLEWVHARLTGGTGRYPELEGPSVEESTEQ